MSRRTEMLGYHPKIDEDVSPRVRAQRDMKSRLNLLLSEVDFKDKVVLDLGCSGGYFSLSLAKHAKKVIAIDGDEEIIKRNIGEAERLGINNVEFICAEITPDLVSSFQKVDVVVFMSVLHHMMGASGIYDWCAPSGQKNISLLLGAIRNNSEIFIFEMGESVSQKENWEILLKKVVPNLDDWIVSEVFGKSFSAVKRLPGVAYNRWPFSRFNSLGGWAQKTKIGRVFCHQTGIDRRDFRTIYVGVR